MRPPPSIFALSENSRLVTRLRVPLAPCCGPGDVEARGGVCLKSSGALEVRCRRVDVEVFASRGLEMRRRRVDVEVFASRDLELGRHAVGLIYKRSGGALQACCLFASRALEMRCRRVYVEVRSSGALEAV